MLRPVRGRIDDDVRLRRVEGAIGLVGEAGSAVGQSRLQDDIAGFEDPIIQHCCRGRNHEFNKGLPIDAV